ncbi:MAG: hypothetical protein A2798_02925 [Candidatus Levybacteria bacterium RIFCSPHIGHO2_01_FULL_37_17]|nr:MAG: hypothetical protein A2798_02925 [Candidatus Levybacteria bacterium RIFCSPHIGHO2_01_FULL_37_17]OGH36810.1 MAG: hypothetical protein A2959_00915 [Candidatus Levybacteria bacterium RIFCSPLOWO2_01_FULL_38_23]
MGKDVFKEIDDIIAQIIKVLETEYDNLIKSGYGLQLKSDIARGLIKVNGIYRPFSEMEHKILFDGYETTFIEMFLELHKKMYERWYEPLTQFAIRTIHEMGFKRTQILFNKKLNPQKIKKFKLLLMLADYAMISDIPLHKNHYIKLLKEYKNLLTKKELDFYKILIPEIEKADPLARYEKIRTARQKINTLQETLFLETEILSIFRKINVMSVNSSFSHLLHGNILLLKDVLQLKRGDSPRLRVYWILLLTGVNVITYVGNFLNESNINKDVEKITKQFIGKSEYIKKYWEDLTSRNPS